MLSHSILLSKLHILYRTVRFRTNADPILWLQRDDQDFRVTWIL